MRFRPKGLSVSGFITTVKNFGQKMEETGKIIWGVLAPFIALVKGIWNMVSKFLGFMSWFSEFAEKHKLTVHMKIADNQVHPLVGSLC